MAVPFDLSRLEVTGGPVPIVEGVMQASANQTGVAHFSFSSNGSLAYVPDDIGESKRTLVWVDRQGAVEPLAAPLRAYNDPRISPNGQQIAVQIIGVPNDVWIYDIPRETLTRLTFEGDNNYPIWTPDGRQVTFGSARAGDRRNLFWKPADGSGAAERLTTSEHSQIPAS